ncbi:hypothetical protein WMY93_015790 [Mugilogobius chulae]|uniref:Uncharacterized protein n=1 Tax=Mugilogobius chulae TaxID=88201 RepID=A0AAW0P3A3_9GOBI
MRQFGPLVALWTIRFEAKHSFFKRVVRHTNCYKNVLLSLARRHQFQTAYYLHTFSFSKPLLEVAEVHSLPIEVLHENIVLQVKQNHPELDYVDLAENVTYNGFNYRIGMVVAHGSLAGLPEFCEIINMVILQDTLFFIVKNLEACWHNQEIGTSTRFTHCCPTAKQVGTIGKLSPSPASLIAVPLESKLEPSGNCHLHLPRSLLSHWKVR